MQDFMDGTLFMKAVRMFMSKNKQDGHKDIMVEIYRCIFMNKNILYFLKTNYTVLSFWDDYLNT